MATKTVGLTLNINELTEDKTSTAWVSGKTVYGRTVTASTEVIQSAGVPAGSITWDDKGGQVKANGKFEDNIALNWSYLNTSYPITFTCSLFDLSVTTTSYTITATSGDIGKSWFNDHFELEANSSTSTRNVSITATGTGLDGNQVSATISSVVQAGSTTPTPTKPKVYVATSENSIEFINNYSTSVRLNQFSVQVGNGTPYGLNTTNDGPYSSGSHTVPATRGAKTGETQYQITLEWRTTDSSTDEEISYLVWKENSNTKSATIDGNTCTFGPYTVSVDTVLSNFSLTAKKQDVAEVGYHYGPIKISNRTSNKTLKLSSGTIEFKDTATSGVKKYTFPGTSTISPGSTVTLFPSYYPNTESKKSGGITVNLTKINFQFDTSYGNPTNIYFSYTNFNSGTDSVTLTTDGSGECTWTNPIQMGYISPGETFSLLGAGDFYVEISY